MRVLIGILAYLLTWAAIDANQLNRRMEPLDRAVVAVNTAEGIYLGWRWLGTDDPDTGFVLYRNGQRLTSEPITNSTNFLDTEGTAASLYSVRAIIDGIEFPVSGQVPVMPHNYHSIPLQVPAGGTTPDSVAYTYSANDASVADLDGDQAYEVILKWDPSNSKDNSQSGYTGNVYLDAYKMDGARLWRIDLGGNIRAGAHYTQFMVYDFDGDGKAEIICKTADGTTDAAGTVIGDPLADHRNSSGYILEGPEFLTVFDGLTGTIVDTVDYIPPRGNLSQWGDTYGNRVDRFLAGVAYFDGVHPSYFAARGQYLGRNGTDGRTAIAAFDLVGRKLVQRWVFDTLEAGLSYAGQGHHQLSVGDADGDGRDEIMYGGMVVDDDGSGLYTTHLGTGDALHFGDLDPTRPGLELFAVKEETNAAVQVEFRDAATGELIWGVFNGTDTGRGLCADIDPTHPGEEVWGAANASLWNAKGDVIGNKRPSINFATWWDADPLRELTDGTSIRKWNITALREDVLMSGSGIASNNGTKATPCLQADLLGDWREEVMFRTSSSDALRIYTTTALTDRRIRTLMHDPIYRLAVAWQNNGYNQPPHPSFFIGQDMPEPPSPPIFTKPVPQVIGDKTGEIWISPVTLLLNTNQAPGLTNQVRLNNGEWADLNAPLILADPGVQQIGIRTLDPSGKVLSTAAVTVPIAASESMARGLSFFGQVESPANSGWLYADRMGWVHAGYFNWVYSVDLGWLAMFGNSFAKGAFAYDFGRSSWWFSSQSHYPWAYVYDSGWKFLGT
ncbi:MAG TPA: rhamnogalacturonan lyase [Oceanipulchritudo sp.]|nr:rhamnogalacturonan lyase [Oceanipulchritudo sp.]